MLFNHYHQVLVYEMVDKELLIKWMIERSYLNPQDIFYSTNYGFNLTPFQFRNFLNDRDLIIEKGKDSRFVTLPLVNFNNQPLFYSRCEDLKDYLSSLASLIEENLTDHGDLVTSRFSNDVLKSRIYSEVEGTLSIEAVQTTGKRVSELASEKLKPKYENDFIIRNMLDGVHFVMEKPEFNRENLHHLYLLLSNEQLEEDYLLHPGELYRYDDVEVDEFQGCPYQRIEECMNSLFRYVDQTLRSGTAAEKFLLPHIAHYYLVYIHTYFDYNGRTARMVSLWLSLLAQIKHPLIISEAIDQTKSDYYRALRDTRNCHNDLTYFLLYLFSISIDYYLCYKNIEIIEQRLKDDGIILTENERAYLKRILICAKGSFIYNDFLKWNKSDMSKQGAFKILNAFESYGVLKAREGKGKTKIFSVNPEFAPYKRKV